MFIDLDGDKEVHNKSAIKAVLMPKKIQVNQSLFCPHGVFHCLLSEGPSVSEVS